MIHILGAGAIGSLYAHYLNIAKIPVTILSRLPQQLVSTRISVNGSHSESLIGNDTSCISTLLVCTKAYDTIPAIERLGPRIKDATIILLQNGVLDVYSDLLDMKSLDYRSIILGSTTHGVIRTHPQQVSHVGIGNTVIGKLDKCSHADNQLLSLLSGAWAPLNTTITHGDKLREVLLLKLAINACINPLVAVLGCPNGALLEGHGRDLIKPLALEIESVFPELADHNIFENVQQVLENTKRNRNSMEQDVEKGRMTEIESITGYLLKEGAKRGLKLPYNEWLYLLIKQKCRKKICT